jgi:glucan phosphorylase
VNHEDIEAVHAKCLFTTHTPVPADHDQFPMELVANVLGHRADFMDMKDLFCVNKRGDLLVRDLARLRDLAARVG